MEVKLVVASGKHAGQVIAVTGEQFLIGRGPDCHVRPSHKEIATQHCAILVEQGRAAVRDLGSPAGTLVNGVRVREEQELKNGDRLRVGPLEFDVHLTVSVGGKKKPAVHSILEAAARTVAKASGAELDVEAWLNEPETKREEPPPAPAAEEQEESPTPQDRGRLFGQSKGPKPAAGNSRDAAADVLKQMFQNKK
jgi:predicted component of type VI protein secretion system